MAGKMGKLRHGGGRTRPSDASKVMGGDCGVHVRVCRCACIYIYIYTHTRASVDASASARARRRVPAPTCVHACARVCPRVPARPCKRKGAHLPGPSSCSRGRWGGCPVLARCPWVPRRWVPTARPRWHPWRAGCPHTGLPFRDPAPCQCHPPGPGSRAPNHRAAFVPPGGRAWIRARVCTRVRAHERPCGRFAGSIAIAPQTFPDGTGPPPPPTVCPKIHRRVPGTCRRPWLCPALPQHAVALGEEEW